MGAKAFGEQNPTQGETAVSWQTWSDGAGSPPTVIGDSNWGKLQLDFYPTEEGRSAVYDLGSLVTRTFTLTENRYGTGAGSARLQIRGSTSTFNQDDVSPTWEDYLDVPIARLWQFVQIRETTADEAQGPLVVSSNARYFTDGSGDAIFLVGSHTWENRQDQSPNGAFSWDDYLDDLVSWGHNFIKLWIWEQPKPPNGLGGAGIVNTTDTLTPEIWLRTGPGNAADGGLKFDLTQYNATHFTRLRQRCIDAGNRGIYVSIMLFNGWSVADKGGSTDPWPNHPFNTANNINSIDGDTNADGDGYETQDHSVAGILTQQDAYVEHVIDTVNDLANVMYEICNEPIGSAGTTAWVDHVIDKIHAYELTKAKQHPVWYTVEYPNGDNATLLASDAEAISPNADVTMDGTKVVIADTDHYFGIGGSADWAWKLLCGGAGGVCYMDSWDNNFLDASGSGHPIQNLRDNLGYIRAMADLADLINMIPTASTYSSTGYCLAGSSQFLCYQPSNGNFTLDLSAESGTFNIRKVNLADGTINTAQTTTGGDTRTITQPDGWTSGWGCWVYK